MTPALRLELARLFTIEARREPFCPICGMHQDERSGGSFLFDCHMGHGAPGDPPDAPHLLAEAIYIAEPVRIYMRHLHANARTPREVEELLELRGFWGMAGHVRLIVERAEDAGKVLRDFANTVESGKMTGGAWLKGPWSQERACAALRWAASRAPFCRR